MSISLAGTHRKCIIVICRNVKTIQDVAFGLNVGVDITDNIKNISWDKFTHIL